MRIIIFIMLMGASFTGVLGGMTNYSNEAQAATQQGINWYEICTNKLVDAMISEPCDGLTTNGGYELSSEGQHVLGCIGGGTLAAITGNIELIGLKSVVGCGGSSSSSSSSSDDGDGIGSILKGILG